MRDLHVVALSEDGRHLLLATTGEATQGGFRVALDDRLQAAVRGELSRSGHAPSETMSVREIQARLRAGESVDDLARAGVPLARVERFGGPVLSEREQVVEQARKAVLVRSRRGPSALPLGEAVALRLSELPSMRADSVEWTARKGDDSVWTVEVSWHSRGRTRRAQWRYDVGAKTVVAVNPASASLAHVEADGRPVDGEAPVPARRVKTGSPAKGGRVGTAAAAGTSSARTRTARATTAEPDAALDRTRPPAAPARTPAAARAGRGATAGGTSTSTPRSTSAARPAAAARTAPAGARRPDVGSDSRPAPSRARGADPSGDAVRPVVRRAPAPFGPAAVPAVRRPPAPVRPTTAPPAAASRAAGTRTAVPRTAVTPRTPVLRPAPEPAVVTRVVVGDGGLVVPAPGAASPAAATRDEPARTGPARRVAGRNETPDPEQRVDRPVGPPSLRVVPPPYDDVDDEADVS